MASWWMIFLGAVQDSLNPCLIMACSALLILRWFFSRKGLAPQQLLRTFIIFVFIFTYLANIGFAVGLLSRPGIREILLMGYYAGAAVCLAGGLLFLSDWVHMLQGKDASPLPSSRLPVGRPWKESRWMHIVVAQLALVLSCGSSLWPMNYYVTMLGNNIIMPGRFMETLGYMFIYSLVVLWVPLGLFLVLSRCMMSVRMERVVYAGFLLSAAATVFFIA